MKKVKRFKSYDGTRLEGTFVSSNGRRDAVVLLVHGINSSRDELGLFSGFAKHLAQEKMHSFRFDYRCHGVAKRSTKFLTLSGIVNDIEAAAESALALSGASQLHIVGMSFGGGLSAFWASGTRIPVLSVGMWAPVIDYEEDVLGQHGLLAKNTLKESAQRLLQNKGALETDGTRYGSPLINELRYISGIEGLKRLTCDCLIVHGDADTVVPFTSSERFVKLNPRCRLINIPGTDHGFGVGDDEDLSSPATKVKHQEVFWLASEFIEKNS